LQLTSSRPHDIEKALGLVERQLVGNIAVIAVATLYHVSVDFLAALLYDPMLGRTLIPWSILTPLHVAVACHCFLGRTGFFLSVRGPLLVPPSVCARPWIR
jgi:hypothetical protein